MTYTLAMQKAFRSLTPPKNFSVQIIDNENFLTVKANTEQFMRLGHDDKISAVEYMIKVKKALEDNGAIVMLVRNKM
jgi:hypothetical protein